MPDEPDQPDQEEVPEKTHHLADTVRRLTPRKPEPTSDGKPELQTDPELIAKLQRQLTEKQLDGEDDDEQFTQDNPYSD